MLVIRCENRRGEKCGKAAHKIVSHAQAANLEKPHIATDCRHFVWLCVCVFVAYV